MIFLKSHVSLGCWSIFRRCVNHKTGLSSKLSLYANLCRLDKPIGTYLLFYPSSWSICLADAAVYDHSKYLLLFAAGSLVMRSFGCIVNDLWDKDIDAKTLRTKDRPIAAEKVSTTEAIALLNFLGLLGFTILFQLNSTTIFMGIISLTPVIFYPLCKRFINLPQLFLGFTFNYGALIGYGAVSNTFAPEIVLPLYASGICWTLVYDTIYGFQDKKDDMENKVLSSSLYFGDRYKTILSIALASQYSLFALAGYNADLNFPFYFSTFCIAAFNYHKFSQINIDDRKSCWDYFAKNNSIGLSLLFSILLGKL